MKSSRRISRTQGIFRGLLFFLVMILIAALPLLASAAGDDPLILPKLPSKKAVPLKSLSDLKVNLPQDIASEEALESLVPKKTDLSEVPKLISEAEKKVEDFSQETVSKIQSSLKRLGYAVKDSVGIIGSDTSAAIKRFRSDFDLIEKSVFSNHTLASLFHYATIAKAHPDWGTVLQSKDFLQWLADQNAQKRAVISKLSDPKATEEVIAVLEAFKKSLKNTAKKTTLVSAKSNAAPKTPSPKTSGGNTPLIDVLAKKETNQKAKSTSKPVATVGKKTGVSSAQVAVPVVSAGAAGKPVEASSALVPEKSDLKLGGASKAIATSEAKTSQISTSGAVSDKDETSKKRPSVESTQQDADTKAPEDSKSAESDSEETAPEVTFENIVSYAESKKGFDSKKTVQWEGGECGCVKDLKGEVYGFYPFWTAGEIQQIDFSLLSRIGYYGLSFDRYGEISQTVHWNPDTADFIIEAQKFRTKVDLVIYKSDWQTWFNFSTIDRLLVLEKSTSNLVAAIDQKIADSLKQSLKTLVASEFSSTMGDGLTLFFDDYPEDPVAVAFFIDFVKMLREKMTNANEEYQLNLMMRMEDIGKGIYGTHTLEQFMGATDGTEDDDIALFLIGLHEPTSDTKKALRLNIEQEFKGIHRKNMLRKIVPVISPKTKADDELRQFTDDLIYFEDNFGGVGFLPLPFIGDPETKTVNSTLTSVFIKPSDSGFMARKLDSELSTFCKFVCPNRWLFRLAFDIVFVLLALYFTAALWSVELRILFKKYVLVFLVVALLALLILYSGFMCDPYWRDKRDGVTIVFILLGGVGWIWRNYLKVRRRAYP